MFAHIKDSVFTLVLMVALFSLQSWFIIVTSLCSLENVYHIKEKALCNEKRLTFHDIDHMSWNHNWCLHCIINLRAWPVISSKWKGRVYANRQFTFKRRHCSARAKSYNGESHVEMSQGHALSCWLACDVSEDFPIVKGISYFLSLWEINYNKGNHW